MYFFLDNCTRQFHSHSDFFFFDFSPFVIVYNLEGAVKRIDLKNLT